MTAPAGRHTRHGMAAVGADVRRFLLWLLPTPGEEWPPEAPTAWGEPSPARNDWHAVACAAGDLLEDVVAVVAILVAAVFALATLTVVALLVGWLLTMTVLAAGGASVLVAWRLRVASRSLAEILRDQLFRKDTL